MISPLRVIYLHSSSSIGGMTLSLCELYKALPSECVKGTIICPRGGAAIYFRAAGMDVIEASGISRWNESLHGYYKGARWAILIRELLNLFPTALAFLKVRRAGPFDLIHANDIDSAYLGGALKRLLKLPLIVHVRCVLRPSSASRRSAHIQNFLANTADRVVVIDHTVGRSISKAKDIEIVHNGLSLDHRAEEPRGRSGEGPMRIAFVGGLLKAKGVLEFAEAARLCHERGLDMEFWTVGENPRTVNGLAGWLLSKLGLSHDMKSILNEFANQHGIEGTFIQKGFVQDIVSIYREVDLVCFPSHVDSPNRPVFEAAYFGVPSIVAVRNPTPDTIVPNETGLCIPSPDPQLLVDAITYFYEHPEERRRMGENAKALAERNFDIHRNAERLLEIYERVVAGSASASAAPLSASKR